MQYVDIVLENLLLDVNSPFRTSFSMEKVVPGDFTIGEIEGIATVLATGLARMSCSNYKVRGFKAYLMEYGSGIESNQWARVGVLVQGELDIAGTRSALPLTKMPYGMGMYVIQNDTRVTGRSGKLVLKTGFWEEMVTAYPTSWRIEGGSVGATQWNSAWALNVGEGGSWGQYFATGTNDDFKMVNLHKGSDVPSYVTRFTQKNINKYRMPKPTLD